MSRYGAAPAGLVGCRVSKNAAAQSILNNTLTNITFDAESIDTHDFHSTATNTERMTIPAGKGGYYRITCFVDFDTNATGIREIYIRKNDTTTLQRATQDSDGYLVLTITDIHLLAAGDFITIAALQTSGGALNIRNHASGVQTSASLQLVS